MGKRYIRIAVLFIDFEGPKSKESCLDPMPGYLDLEGKQQRRAIELLRDRVKRRVRGFGRNLIGVLGLGEMAWDILRQSTSSCSSTRTANTPSDGL